MKFSANKKTLIIGIIVLLYLINIPETKAQDCNLDFEYGDFVNWRVYTGTCCPVNANVPGLVNGRHIIMTLGGTDPETGGNLPFVFEKYLNF